MHKRWWPAIIVPEIPDIAEVAIRSRDDSRECGVRENWNFVIGPIHVVRLSRFAGIGVGDVAAANWALTIPHIQACGNDDGQAQRRQRNGVRKVSDVGLRY